MKPDQIMTDYSEKPIGERADEMIAHLNGLREHLGDNAVKVAWFDYLGGLLGWEETMSAPTPCGEPCSKRAKFLTRSKS